MANPLRLAVCASPEAEAAFAAREILRHVHGGGRFRDCAVVLRTLDHHHTALRRAFTRRGIPFFLDRREPVAHHPLAELTRFALRTLAFGWLTEDFLGALKTGLLHDRDGDIDWLENLALANGWRGAQWLEPLPIPDAKFNLARAEQLRAALTAPLQKLARELAIPPPVSGAQLASALYVGPKEFRRLTNSEVFKQDQDKVMQFSRFFIFRWCSQILSRLMSFYHSVLPASAWAWGFAIMLATLTLKVVFLPLTFAAARSMKRMQKIQPEMVALREKYKDNPRKMQEGMMELYKVHKVNPLGGCIPMLLPMPFFMGFFFMLPSTAELRFAPFLWAADLSAPDTITRVLGFPINILPILMGATMVFQMRLVPQAPTTDNLQLKMMKFMPYMFTAICYNSYACSLAIYSTANGIFTIGQQMVINRMKDADEAPAVAVGPGGKVIKNVTPKK